MLKPILILTVAGTLLVAGNASGASPTVGGVKAGSGCSVQCIDYAQVSAGPSVAGVVIGTDTPARIAVKVSEQAPAMLDGNPWIPSPDAVDSTGGEYRTSWGAALDGLEPGTLYHIVVSATDAQGHTAHRQGTFKTLGRKVTVTFWGVRILNDADHDCCIWANKGEIQLDYFAAGQHVHSSPMRKLKSGQWVDADDPAPQLVLEDAPAQITLQVQGEECDKARKKKCVFEGWGDGVLEGGLLPASACKNERKYDRACATWVVDVAGLLESNGLPYMPNDAPIPAGHDSYQHFVSDGGPDRLKFVVYASVDVSYG